jgi:hypothetical protein
MGPTLLDQRRAEKSKQLKQRTSAAPPAAAGSSSSAAADGPAHPTATNSAQKSRTRFNTLNTFVDAVGRYLPPSDREVWHVLFRFADGATNIAEVRHADIAPRLGFHTRTVKRSIDRLIACGLLERLKRGTRQGGPSRYRLDPEPSRHLPAIRAGWQESSSGGKRLAGAKSPEPNRTKSGQFTT